MTFKEYEDLGFIVEKCGNCGTPEDFIEIYRIYPKFLTVTIVE